MDVNNPFRKFAQILLWFLKETNNNTLDRKRFSIVFPPIKRERDLIQNCNSQLRLRVSNDTLNNCYSYMSISLMLRAPALPQIDPLITSPITCHWFRPFPSNGFSGEPIPLPPFAVSNAAFLKKTIGTHLFTPCKSLSSKLLQTSFVQLINANNHLKKVT